MVIKSSLINDHSVIIFDSYNSSSMLTNVFILALFLEY